MSTPTPTSAHRGDSGPRLSLDLTSAVPPFEQVRRQLAALITTGQLAPGRRLPTVRALAADLGVAVNTIGRAYKELESAGLVQSRRRAGTVIIDRGDAPGDGPASDVLQPQLRALIEAAIAAGIEREHLIDLVSLSYDEHAMG